MNRPDPLTPEERELARLLGRPSTTGPAPAIDEAVLAAARTAVEAPSADAASWKLPPDAPARPRRPRSRLPAVFGLAASVIFAVGIAWQLKPDDPPAPPLAEPVAAPASAAAVTEAAPAMEAAPPPPPAAAPPGVEPQRAAKATTQSPRQQAAAAPPAPERARGVSSPRPEDIPAPAPPAPAPVQAPAPMMSAPAPEAASSYAMEASQPALDSVVVTGSTTDRSAPRAALKGAAPAKPAPGAPGVMRRAAAPMAAPASADEAVRALHQAVAADAGLPRKQWLKRIRERRDAGDVDTARASLERYLQQYPEVRIPRDLRQLLEN
ncbi:hypothetical protein CEE60_06760 [Stenotrophomonas maltophilia]|uniref:Proline/alanine-rich repetetive membrane anchored protein n=1 Tax=Stenotrophomonas maltophilia TaxID=40324 RepID=A0A246HNZ6_STEMA|nr:hypothetical protein [Stenotrophomonas maltophilia]OWQ54974.1 hypothetical protein CEE60_06760 [Stenotrophomonas maltophilia]